MSIQDRIEKLIHLTNGKQNLFAEAIGIPASTINSIVGPRKRDPSFSILKKIINTYPAVNLNWLMNGSGEPLIDRQTKQDQSSIGNIISELSKKDTEISERVSLMIHKLSSNPNSFATDLGYERSQTIYDIINGKSAPSYDFFRRFMLSEYSKLVSIDWLLTGRGKMMIEKEPTDKQESPIDTND